MDTASLQLDHVPVDRLSSQPPEWWQTVLGVVGFDQPPSVVPAGVPAAASMTPWLSKREKVCEVWRVKATRDEALRTGSLQQGRVSYRCNRDLLFGSIVFDEKERGDEGASAVLREETTRAYQDIFAVLEETQHTNLLRVWNYLPEITRDADGEERYRHFNSARQAAFRDSGRSTVGTVPAASALGSPAGSLTSIYFLASREAATMIENPRQTSAYYYPPKFGPHSPVFSRACLLNNSEGTSLFVSGTASIVGHETIHQGNVIAQTRETVANIDALLGEANRVGGSVRYSLDGLKFKVYVRNPTDLGAIEMTLARTLSPATSILYLQADVCREDLLVEIEATGDSQSC